MNSIKLYEGNCLDVLRKCPDNYMDSIVCDPPYGLSFMNRLWDYQVPSTEIWKECLRVLKPGGHLLAFGGTRTYHRLVVNIEDAGFEIRDQIMWIYGSGFPKSMDISKAIDKEAGAEREVLGTRPAGSGPLKTGHVSSTGGGMSIGTERSPELQVTAPATDDAKRWSGYGTALKPANEPICLARKPLSEKTVAKNVLKHGCGGLNVDASRIEGVPRNPGFKNPESSGIWGGADNSKLVDYVSPEGRFPANILFDEFAAGVLDEQTPGNSRFFYVAKASKAERNKGLEHLPAVVSGVGDERPSGQSMQRLDGREPRAMQNFHPTVKPVALMEYLIKLVTPEGGTVLDPFMGSGTTGVAAQNLGFSFRGIEMNPEYFKIAQARILGATQETA